MALPDAVVRRFLECVVQTSEGCWGWRGQRNNEYGYFEVDGTRYSATRVSWELSGRELPTGKLLCHTCDNPPCSKPEHLFPGTHQENALDAIAKGRRPKRVPRLQQTNQRRRLRKLSAETIQEIRNAKGSVREIARRFNVSHTYVWQVRHRELATNY